MVGFVSVSRANHAFLALVGFLLSLCVVFLGAASPARAQTNGQGSALSFGPGFDYIELRLSQYHYPAFGFAGTSSEWPTRHYAALEASDGPLDFGIVLEGFNSRNVNDIYGRVTQFSLGYQVSDTLTFHAFTGANDQRVIYGEGYNGWGVEFERSRVALSYEHLRYPFSGTYKTATLLYQASEDLMVYAMHTENSYQRYVTTGLHYETAKLTLDAYAHFFPGYFEYGTLGLSARYRMSPDFMRGDLELFGSLWGGTEYHLEDGIYTVGVALPVHGNLGLEATVSSYYGYSSQKFYGLHLVYKRGKTRHRVNTRVTDYLRAARPPYLTYYDSTPVSRGFRGYLGTFPTP